jgi:Phosphate-induced protein 1 conserved region
MALSSWRNVVLIGALFFASAASVSAQNVHNVSQLRPTGHGWPVQDASATPAQQTAASAVTTGNAINYHGGQVMPGNVNVYFIWYGDWGRSNSNSPSTQNLLRTLFGEGGIGGSAYAKINSTYGDNAGNVSGELALAAETAAAYPYGKRLSDANVEQIVTDAVSSRALPSDANGVYFVLTSSDVAETSGLCVKYCGWHSHAMLNGSDLKFAFVGNPDRCPAACEWQTNSPNGISGADGMASVMTHELQESISDPHLDAWYDTAGNESSDKCAWKFGPVKTTSSGAQYNQTFAGHNWLIQMNWLNAWGGGCVQSYDPASSALPQFYTR